jgi:tripartite-type tricarboxylate transporter receptor subunit TctC
MEAGRRHRRFLLMGWVKNIALRRSILTHTKAFCHQVRSSRRKIREQRLRDASNQPLVFAGRSVTALLFAFALSAVVARPVFAQDYPDRAVKIIVPFAAGGTADAVPRFVGDWLSRKWGQPVVIENRTGAAGNIGAEFAYNSAPDGYTLLSSPPPPLVINQNLYPKLGFDPGKFEPIIVMAHVPNALIVNPGNLKASSVPELIDYLRKNPDKVTAATQGNGTTSHLTAELFQVMAKVKLRAIPYRGSAPALQGLLAGDVDLMFDNLGVSLPLVEAGNLKLLAVASSRRLPSLPDVPTIAETLPGFEAVAWYAIMAPPGTPKNITDKINADVNEALRQPELQDRLRKLSAETFGGSVEMSAQYMREEVERWGNVIKAADIKLQ